MMTKSEQFLWMVQTAILANGINLATGEETRNKYRHVYSSTGVRITMTQAIRASELIPDRMTAADACDEFCIWMFKNHQDSVVKDDPNFSVPSWFAQ